MGDRGSAAETSPLRRGDAIDRFTVLELLGEGGMGVVVSAYDPTLDRKVAIKVLRPDRLAADPDKGRARLLREAQAMARLRHPNVITVYEVGTIDEQVFVAMELVEGTTLSGWIELGARGWRDVVATFVQAGRGLAAAHRAGLVHRDFKPDNVLVGGGDVRVTDFGLAGVSPNSPAAEAGLALSISITRSGAILGTPAYMSPEQHKGGEADARSDQFSFCVALYEALYGVRPFEGESPAAVLDAILAARRSPPRREAPRWLRAVVLRGLAARPEDRWPDMDALLQALARDPVAARRRWLLAGGMAALLGGAAWVFLADRPALCQGGPARAAALWNQAAREKVRAAFLATRSPIAADVFGRVDRLMAGQAADWAAAYTDTCEATHVRGDQSVAMLDLRMRCLERSRRQIGSLVEVWSREAADVEKAIGAAIGAGDVTACADTAALAQPAPIPRDPAAVERVERIRAQLDAIEAHRRAGRLASGLALAREAVGHARGAGHAPTLAEALYRNGHLECEVGKIDAGVPLLYEAARIGAAAHDDVLVAKVFRDLLFYVGVRQKQLDQADGLWKIAEVALERADRRDKLLGELLLAQGALRNEQNRHQEGLALVQRALTVLGKVHPPDHPDIARVLHTIAFHLHRLGKHAEAEATYRRVLEITGRAFGPEHPSVAIPLNNLANTLLARGDYAEASRTAERSLAIREKVYKPDHPTVAMGLHTLALVRDHQGRAEESRALNERAERIKVGALGKDHVLTLETRHNLASVLLDLGDTRTGRRLLASVLPGFIEAFGEEHPVVAEARATLGTAMLRDEDVEGAEGAFTRAITILRDQEASELGLPAPLHGLGQVRTLQRRYDEAIALHREARAMTEKVRGPDHPYLAEAHLGLGMAHLGAGRFGPAIVDLERAIAIGEKLPGESRDLAVARFQLARALWASGQRKRAMVLARKARDDLAAKRMRDDLGAVEGWLRTRSRARGKHRD
jgi:eukaryotic-like serine/threonine-protein kinase